MDRRTEEDHRTAGAQSEELRAVLDRAPAMIATIGGDGTYTYANLTYCEVLAVDPQLLIGRRPAEVVPHFCRVEDKFAAAMNGSPQRYEFQRDTAAGTRWFEVHLIPAARSAAGILSFVVDVTERKLAEESVRQLQKMDAIGRMTGGIAHDFNNLISVFIGELELAEMTLPEEHSAHEGIQNALAAAERAGELTRRLLATTRKQPLTPTVVDLDELVSNMGALFRRTLGERLRIEVVPSARPIPCIADVAQLENALLNLAINARDAMPSGGTLTLRTSLVSIPEGLDRPSGEFARVSVQDTGSGIRESVLPSIYEPFFTTKKVGAGSGLGLSMVYRFAIQSEGHLSLETELGRGTEFHLDLPWTSAGDDDNETHATRAGTQAHVLLVEDDRAVRRMASKQLESLGFGVTESEDGRGALDCLRGPAHFDVLLTDVVLPGQKSGLDLAREARKLHPEIRIIVMSGYLDDATSEEVDELADAPLLRKPFRHADLARILRRVLDIAVS